MDKKLIQKIYDATRNNAYLTSTDKLAKHLGMSSRQVSQIMNNSSKIRTQVRMNRDKSGINFNDVLRMMCRISTVRTRQPFTKATTGERK